MTLLIENRYGKERARYVFALFFWLEHCSSPKPYRRYVSTGILTTQAQQATSALAAGSALSAFLLRLPSAERYYGAPCDVSSVPADAMRRNNQTIAALARLVFVAESWRGMSSVGEAPSMQWIAVRTQEWDDTCANIGRCTETSVLAFQMRTLADISSIEAMAILPRISALDLLRPDGCFDRLSSPASQRLQLNYLRLNRIIEITRQAVLFPQLREEAERIEMMALVGLGRVASTHVEHSSVGRDVLAVSSAFGAIEAGETPSVCRGNHLIGADARWGDLLRALCDCAYRHQPQLHTPAFSSAYSSYGLRLLAHCTSVSNGVNRSENQ